MGWDMRFKGAVGHELGFVQDLKFISVAGGYRMTAWEAELCRPL